MKNHILSIHFGLMLASKMIIFWLNVDPSLHGPILRRGVNPPPLQNPRGRNARSAYWAQRPGQKGLGFQGLSGLAFEASPGLTWPPWPGLWRPVLASFGRFWLHLALPGMPWLALASFGLAYGVSVSGRGSPDPAFVSALAVFSKGQAFAFEA